MPTVKLGTKSVTDIPVESRTEGMLYFILDSEVGT